MDFIMYPPGEDWAERYDFPLNLGSPQPSDILIRLADGSTFFAPPGTMVSVESRLSNDWGLRSVAWMTTMAIEDLMANVNSPSESVYVTVLSLSSPVNVVAEAVTGTLAERVPVEYVLNATVKMAVVSGKVYDGSAAMNPVTVDTIAPGATPVNCQCVLTNSPCGERLVAVITPPGVAP